MEEEQAVQSNSEESEVEEEEQNTTTKTKQAAYIIPKEFGKAKRTLTKMVNSYFTNLKQELLEKGGKFIYNRECISTVESAFSKLATIRYVELNSVTMKKIDAIDEFLVSYVSESKKIIKYNLNIHNNNQQKPRELSLEPEIGVELPDTATPAVFGANAYIFDGSNFDINRMVYVPTNMNLKLNLITGQVCRLEHQPEHYRMKSCILKTKRGFYILGGYIGSNRSLTKRCELYCVSSGRFNRISSLNKFHNSPSGCVHNDKLYLLSCSGIEIYDQDSDEWSFMELPNRLKCLPFQYCISVSEQFILIMGGKFTNRNSSDVKLFNTSNNNIDEFIDVLPVGVTSERSWGPIVMNGFTIIMSTIQAAVYPQVAIKKDAVQVVFIGGGGCFMNILMAAM